jgi:excisionase family DNA binding protein
MKHGERQIMCMKKDRLDMLKTPWVSVGEVAEALGISRKTVLRYCVDGTLTAVRIGVKSIRIDARSVKNMIHPLEA